MYYLIIQIGSEIHKRYLGYNCVHWTSFQHAFKFPLLAQAIHETENHENARIIWVNEWEKTWGEMVGEEHRQDGIIELTK